MGIGPLGSRVRHKIARRFDLMLAQFQMLAQLLLNHIESVPMKPQ